MSVILAFALVMAILANVAVLIGAYNVIESLRDDVENEKSSHEACHKATLNVLRTASTRTVAAALNMAADQWDSIEGRAERDRLARAYVEGGPSVPAMWLRHEADKMIEERA